MTTQYQLTDTISSDLVLFSKELALMQARVVQVTCESEQHFAAQVGREIHLLRKAIEKERKRLVEPHLAGQRIANRLAADVDDPLAVFEKRIAGLLADFDKQEQKRVEDLKAQQKSEFDKLEAERQSALADMKSAPTLSGQIAAEQRANELAQVSRDILLAPAVALRAEGTRVRPNEVDFEITDVRLAYASAPHLFYEPQAKPLLIKSLPLTTQIPGIRLFTKTSVNFTQ